MSSEPTKWEPSEASIAEYHKMRFRVWGRGGDHAEETKLALKAAVAADPLLSAAAEMRDALAEVNEWINAWDPSFRYDGEWPEMQAKIDAALAKANGE